MVNVSQVTEEGKTEKHLSASTRIYILISVSSLIGFLSSVLLERGLLLPGIVGIVLFAAIFIAQLFFLEGRLFKFAAVSSNAISIALPFFALISPLFMLAFSLLALLLLHGIYRGQHITKNIANSYNKQL